MISIPKLLMGISLILVVLIETKGSYARNTLPANSPENKLTDQLQEHLIRKSAAKRLKSKYENTRQEQLLNTDGKPNGYKLNSYTGKGQAGNTTSGENS